jgi:radical SAM protein with 4Fe4S-binding SPASM domain
VSYLRVTRTPMIRKMPLGTYLYVPSSSRLEMYSPIMEIDETTEELLALCNGKYTREEILQDLSQKSGEPVEEIAEGFDEFVDYLVGEGVLEWRETPSQVEPIYKRDRPFRILVDVTSACDLQCPFCQADTETCDELTMDDVVHFVEQVKKMKPSLVTLSGGEPLLKKDIVLYMVGELSQVEEIGLYILTNGAVVTKEYAQQLYDAGLRFARVCVDGHTDKVHDLIRGNGTFEKTIQGIIHLREAGIHVTVVTLICNMNYPYFKEIKEFVSQVADGYTIVFDYPCGKGDNSDFLLSSEERSAVRLADLGSEDIETGVFPQNRCHVGEILYVTACGDCYPCLYMNFPEFKIGNIKEKDISEIYKNEVLQGLLRLTIHDIEQCRECTIRYYCRGGCRGHAYGECGSVYVPDPLDCAVNKAAVQRILEGGEEKTRALMEELIASSRLVR